MHKLICEAAASAFNPCTRRPHAHCPQHLYAGQPLEDGNRVVKWKHRVERDMKECSLI